MDFVKGLTGGNKEGAQTQESTQKSSGGIMDKLNNMAGGGAKGEQKEDALDKGIYSAWNLSAQYISTRTS